MLDFDPSVEELNIGKYLESSGRSVGKHEHCMLTLASTEFHATAGGLSYVGSGEFEIETGE